MSTSLGLSDVSLVGSELTVPAVPTFPTTVPLPTTIDGNVIAPPNVTPTTPGGGTPVGIPPVPAMPAPPEPTFWDIYGEPILTVFSVVGVISTLGYIAKRMG